MQYLGTIRGMARTCFGVCLALTCVTPAFAITSADTLPKGVRAGAFVFGSAEGVREGFNETGRLEGLTHDFNKSITLDELAVFEPKLKTLKKFLNDLSPNQLGESLLVADLYADVDVNERRYVGAVLWGITNSLSIGVQVPFVKRDTNAEFKVKTINNAEKIKQIVGSVPQINEGLAQLAETSIDTELFNKEIFTKNGYEVPRDFSSGGIGDIELETRYGYFKSKYLSLSLRGALKAPTASHTPNISNILDRPMGEGTYSYRVGTYHDLRLIPSILSFNTSVNLSFKKSFIQKTALPKTKEQALPDLNDPSQIRDIRYHKPFVLNVDAGLMLDVYKGVVSFSGSYIYSANGPLRISGDLDGVYSNRLTLNTESQSQALEFGVELSSIPLFLAGKMPLPGKFTLTWSQPIGGRNTLFTPYGRMDVVLLF